MDVPLSREQQQAVVALNREQGLEYSHTRDGGRDEFFLPTVGGSTRSMLADVRKRAMSEVWRAQSTCLCSDSCAGRHHCGMMGCLTLAWRVAERVRWLQGGAHAALPCRRAQTGQEDL